ncbi:low molecular weight protein-tyrosine-phosphatase [Virgibacillus salexigens]|uniref:low molecular weight protein-tyrosine-phosphatase n=1 Tax=Virgibacillus salexigens TaxID=61016 RepID=UPI00190D1D85|nr:low molecular weight protein-tyrosine-phosphatase [Virgibacillus salexigens]
MIRVLFACLGNICRSPMAEAIFLDLIKKDRLTEYITVDSAGTESWHMGEEPHQETKEILTNNNISWKGLVARQVDASDVNQFDYIIAMDDQNKHDLLQLFGASQQPIIIAKLMDFVNQPEKSNIPDPYYTGNFSDTYQLVLEGCQQLLQFIKEKHSIS